MTTTPTPAQLLPCPFCGGEAWIINSPVSDQMAVMCRSCDATGGLRSNAGVATSAWNHRTPAPEQAVVDEPRVERWRKASGALGTWMSAALDDPKVCDAMKADINEWFSAGEPFEAMAEPPAEQQPVAFRYAWGKRDVAFSTHKNDYFASQPECTETPLYANPPAQQPGEMREKIALQVAYARGFNTLDDVSLGTADAILALLVGRESAFRDQQAGLLSVDDRQGVDDEALGEALFFLSDKLRASGFLNDDANHAAYERVVAAFNASKQIAENANCSEGIG